MELTVQRSTTASPAAVWEVMTDLERLPDVLSGVTAVERLDGGEGFGPGTRWRETRELFGREASEELEVTAVEAPEAPGARSYTVEAESGGTRYRSLVSVEPAEQGSLLTMTFGGEQGGGRVAQLLTRVVGRFFQGATRKALQQDLDDIAAAAEARPEGA